MKLHDCLWDAVADVRADLPELAAASRRQGLGIRRRRRVLATVGAATGTAVIVATGCAVLAAAGHGTTAATDPASSTSPAVTIAPLSGRTAPLTGRGVVAGLAAGVREVADGSFASFRGTGLVEQEAMGEFLFRPAGTGKGSGGLVQIDLQSLRAYGRAAPYGCIREYMVDCTVDHLPDGDTLRSYTDLSSGAARGYRRQVAEVLSPVRNLRLILSAANTDQNENHVVRRDPVLSDAQLRAVATQPWWDLRRLPVEYVAAGSRLPSYADLAAGS